MPSGPSFDLNLTVLRVCSFKTIVIDIHTFGDGDVVCIDLVDSQLKPQLFGLILDLNRQGIHIYIFIDQYLIILFDDISLLDEGNFEAE